MSGVASGSVRLIAESNYGLRFIVLPYLLVSLFFYAFVQLQEAVLGQLVLVHLHLHLVGLVGTLLASLAYLFRRSRVRLSQPRLFGFTLAYTTFVVFDFVLKLARGDIRPAAAVYGEAFLYFFVFLIPLMLVISDNGAVQFGAIVERGAFRALYLLAVPVFGIGYAQFISNAPLLSVGDETEGYAVQSYLQTDTGHTRAFSVFGSAFSYGHFITLVGALTLSYLCSRRTHEGRGWYWALFAAAAAAAFTTLTRNTYLEFGVTIMGVLLIPRLIRMGWENRGIILASAVASVVLYGAIVVFFLVAFIEAGGLLNLSTFEIRLASVAGVVRRYFVEDGSTQALLLGHGFMQGSKFADLQGIRRLVFDNTYVDIALFSGLVGLVFWVVFFLLMFGFVLNSYRRTGAYWWLALSGMYFSYPVVAALNIHTSVLYLITSLVLGYDILARRRALDSNGAPAKVPRL
jgi:hypothetical protein